jgi:DNA-binding transcriptional ArsR family regulator
MMVDNSGRTLYRNLTMEPKPVPVPHPFNPAVTPMDTDLTAVDAARMCKALGHPARIGILRQLLREERCICGRIVEVLPLAQSTVSQHLKVLKEAGLIIGEVEGPRTCYCADRQRLATLATALSALLSPCREEHQ